MSKMFNKNKKFKSYRSYKDKEGLVTEKMSFKAEVPTPEKVDVTTKEIDYVAFKDLQFTGSIEVKADPNTEIARGDYPYAIVNKTNKVVEANYPGDHSLFGNSLVRLQNSVSSQMLNCFDAICMEKRFNYLYLALDDDAVNLSYNMEMLKAFEQAFSKGYSTMLTQLPFAVDYTESGLPRGDASLPVHGQTNDSYDKMGALIHYQTVLQNIVSPIAKYVELMSEEQDLKNMSYRRETPSLDELYGQFKKKAFIAKLESLGATVLSEYFDMNWWRQVNTLRHIPSRKADDMLNPIVTIASSHTIPDLKLYATETKTEAYYDYAKDMKFTGQFLDPETYVKDAKGHERTLTFEELILNINKLLDPTYVLRFIRQFYQDELPSGAIRDTSTYYQGVVDYITAISYLGGKFSGSMTEIRTFIDKLSETGMVYWEKNIHFSVAHITDLKLNFYQVVNDVLKASLAGASSMKYDDSTKRWNCYTMWDIYLGFNKFDNYAGGAFLAFSLRDINLNYVTPTGTSETLSKSDTALLLPLLFNKNFLTKDLGSANGKTGAVETGYISNHILAITRTGTDVHLGHFDYSAADFSADKLFSRLNPLNTSISMKVPTWNMNRFKARWANKIGATGDKLAHTISSLVRTLVQICGYCRIDEDWVAQAGQNNEPVLTSTISADPDLLCVLDLQFQDVSNQMITYARNYSPFRVSTPNGKRTQGFGV